jgi:NAD(P)H-dependent flavin oxidoreductase YrpB (nitropropane dioxygenase family)
VDAVDVPVVAAGGFFDGRGLVAALAYGASGIAMGTRFLLTRESDVPDNVKHRYLDAAVTDTVVTAKIDGHPHRMIRTPFVERVDQSGRWRGTMYALRNTRQFMKISGSTPRALLREGRAMHKQHGYGVGQVVLAANAPMLCRAAMVEGRTDYGIMSGGQVMGLIEDLPSCADLVARIVAEANDALERLRV